MLFETVRENIEKNKQRILKGLSNTITWGFPLLENYLPGIEREKFYGITANVSVGKSKLAKYLFVTSPFDYWRNNPNETINILYYSLEESKSYFLLNMISYYLYKTYGIKKSTKEILSLKSPIDDFVLQRIDQLKPLIEELLKVVTIVDDLRQPTEIFKHALANIKEGSDTYNIIVVDHISLLLGEKGSPTTREAMTKFTGEYCLYLRDHKKCTICAVQQQAAETENLDHFKEMKLEPSLNGLGDNKLCGRDYNVLLGLFAPSRHEISNYRGYDVTKLGDNYRALWVLKDREGEANIVDHLYFDGRVNYFKELPRATELNYSIL